jgi:hypothetical protein
MGLPFTDWFGGGIGGKGIGGKEVPPKFGIDGNVSKDGGGGGGGTNPGGKGGKLANLESGSGKRRGGGL